ncbi:restriction endonuclease subunit S [Segatella sp.]|uniref:restriction endonuclease subunit S n=1 Tax=Segatella sp. TaxID=2974253 RepID=UPI00307A8CBC
MEWKLKDLTVDGKGSYGIGAPAVPYQEDKLTYLRITDINDDGSLNFSDLKSVDAEDAEKYILKENDIVFARTGNSTGRSYFYEKQHGTFVYAGFLIKFSLDPNKVNPRILKYYTHSKPYFDWVNSFDTGATRGNINAKTYGDMEIELPSRKVQDKIVSILSSLDRKIELNNKINADLEEMAQAIFKNWFVDFEPFKDGKFVDSELGMIPEGWKVGRLTEIASYMNGLAMQKFPPENNEDSLPVLKIKELGQGFCGTDSDRCSCNIKDECKIHNGDVIFSWSGTLLVDVWCGGDCGLNQHLFKVTSKDYPKWFYYYWTKHHLQEFIHIAKDKAVTMGHIKRGHLEEALVAIPDNDSMERAHELFEPILSKMISLRLENSRLSLLRDTLLPRLMSGELEVPE